MERRYVYKMVQSCLGQYNWEKDSIPCESTEFAEIYEKVMTVKKDEPETDLHDIVSDIVYGYVTGSPYF
ncbi:YqzH family protein [Cytobacillus gottheilii]|uniref:YqzH-like protein n=1 Tax=Cytobacillus gottheilii TaxID=859144 RepID=A0ABX8F8D4_9BACI|nr:YqzH family protein [Cytobacillus gottheilii]QVY60249.1 hypothetical protein J1899_14605 [Cytobacillus gottheilii]